MPTDEKWNKVLTDISNLYKNYSLTDIASSLFVSSLWLPNNGSTVKHQLHTAIFATIKPNQFKSEANIKTFKDFKTFCSKLFELTPEFPSLEDYIPNFDWGEVKYHHDGVNYKIFYGTEISHVYDFLTAFELLFVEFNQEYLKLSGRSPSNELAEVLSIQNDIVNNIDTQPPKSYYDNLELGHIEIPSQKFWIQGKREFERLSLLIKNSSLKEEFSIEIGSEKLSKLNWEDFGQNVFEGTLVPALFIKQGNSYYPLIPRRYSGVFIENWSRVFVKYKNLIKKGSLDYQSALSLRISEFIASRSYKEDFFQIVSALEVGGKPHELTFSGYLISED